MMLIPLHLSRSDFSQKALSARAELHAAAAQLNPRGFRSPGRRGTSSVEKAAIAAGQLDGSPPEKSARGKAKQKVRRLHFETVKAQQAKGFELRENRKRGHRP